MDWTEEMKPCAVCGKSVEAINLFPGKRCLACFEKHFDTLTPEQQRPDFTKTVNL